MQRLIYFVATSLDGFIAGNDGALDWLFSDQDYGYYDFLRSIGTTLMGGATYRMIRNFGGPFPYPELRNVVFSRQEKEQVHPSVMLVSSDPIAYSRHLLEGAESPVWLIGGGELARQLVAAGLVSDWIIAQHPVLLGEGVPLAPFSGQAKRLTLLSCKTYATGLVQLHYQVPAEATD